MRLLMLMARAGLHDYLHYAKFVHLSETTTTKPWKKNKKQYLVFFLTNVNEF